MTHYEIYAGNNIPFNAEDHKLKMHMLEQAGAFNRFALYKVFIQIFQSC